MFRVEYGSINVDEYNYKEFEDYDEALEFEIKARDEIYGYDEECGKNDDNLWTAIVTDNFEDAKEHNIEYVENFEEYGCAYGVEGGKYGETDSDEPIDYRTGNDGEEEEIEKEDLDYDIKCRQKSFLNRQDGHIWNFGEYVFFDYSTGWHYPIEYSFNRLQHYIWDCADRLFNEGLVDNFHLYCFAIQMKSEKLYDKYFKLDSNGPTNDNILLQRKIWGFHKIQESVIGNIELLLDENSKANECIDYFCPEGNLNFKKILEKDAIEKLQYYKEVFSTLIPPDFNEHNVLYKILAYTYVIPFIKPDDNCNFLEATLCSHSSRDSNFKIQVLLDEDNKRFRVMDKEKDKDESNDKDENENKNENKEKLTLEIACKIKDLTNEQVHQIEKITKNYDSKFIGKAFDEYRKEILKLTFDISNWTGRKFTAFNHYYKDGDNMIVKICEYLDVISEIKDVEEDD